MDGWESVGGDDHGMWKRCTQAGASVAEATHHEIRSRTFLGGRLNSRCRSAPVRRELDLRASRNVELTASETSQLYVANKASYCSPRSLSIMSTPPSHPRWATAAPMCQSRQGMPPAVVICVYIYCPPPPGMALVTIAHCFGFVVRRLRCGVRRTTARPPAARPGFEGRARGAAGVVVVPCQA